VLATRTMVSRVPPTAHAMMTACMRGGTGGGAIEAYGDGEEGAKQALGAVGHMGSRSGRSVKRPVRAMFRSAACDWTVRYGPRTHLACACCPPPFGSCP
jgi:hypothetical protein